MKTLPVDIKIAIVIAILLLVTIVAFLIFLTVLYSRKQALFEKEKKLKAMQFQTQLLQKEIDFQKRTQNEQERISHDMHDDIGAGISAIKLQAEFIKQKTNDPEIALNIDELLQTCADLNISMRQVLWNLKLGNDNIQNFTEHIIQYARNFFGKTEVKIQVIKEEFEYDLISAETRRNLFLCVKETLNNIYKHSHSKNIVLHFSQNGKYFSVEISDDGVGLKADTEYGNGLDNMKSRMESVCGRFNFVPSDKGLHISLRVNVEPTASKVD
ncbi:MAG: sensor histidine kinase [Kaistella sp.]